MRVLAAYWSSERQISITQMAKTEKTQYNNTNFIVLGSWLGVLLAAPGVRTKKLKATQVHDSYTPSLSHRDWWGSGHYIIT